MIKYNDVVTALKREEPFNDSDAFADIEPCLCFIPQFIERMGYEDLTITLQGIHEIVIQFLLYMIECGYASGMIVARAALDNLIENLQEDAEDIPRLLERIGMTEEEFLLNDDSALNEEAKALYREGKLTYGLLATTSPRAFIQYESAG